MLNKIRLDYTFLMLLRSRVVIIISILLMSYLLLELVLWISYLKKISLQNYIYFNKKKITLAWRINVACFSLMYGFGFCGKIKSTIYSIKGIKNKNLQRQTHLKLKKNPYRQTHLKNSRTIRIIKRAPWILY